MLDIETIRFASLDMQPLTDPASSIRRQAAAGVIDTIWCYADEDDRAHPWLKVIGDDAYDQTSTCFDVLEAFTSSSRWRKVFEPVACYVDLGVGDGRKIASIVKRFGNGRHTSVVGLDISRTLLRAFRGHFFELQQHMPLNVLSAHARFADLPDILAHPSSFWIRRLTGPTATFILGNTFGNLDEASVFRTLRATTKGGDLLVLSLEFAAIGKSKKDDASLLAPYVASPAVTGLLSRPLRYLRGEVGPFVFRLAHNDSRFTGFPDTRSVYGCALVDQREVVTVHSNRYDFAVLVGQFQAQGFDLVGWEAVEQTAFFRYVVFRRAS